MTPFLRRLAGIAVALAALGYGAVSAQVTTSYSGILTVMWGDPKPGHNGGAVRFELTESNGTTHALEIAPDQQNRAIQFFGKRVTVQGHASAERAADGPPTIVVDDISAAQPTKNIERQTRAPIVRKVLFALLRFKGDTQMTHPARFYDRELTNPQTPPVGSQTPASINGFFNKTSYGSLQWSADVVGKNGLNSAQWFTLPRTKAQYASCDFSGVCAKLGLLRSDALALVAGVGVDISNYDNINFVVNNDLDCCAWGGSFSDGMKVYGNTFEPPWGQEAGVYVHEMGHSIGLPHSGWRYYDYDSHHDQMSRGNPAQTVVCGSYDSANDGVTEKIRCTEPGAGYIMAHKDFLGWIPDANKAVVSTVGTQVFTIEAGARPLGSRLKMVVVCIFGRPCNGGDGSAARFLTIEVKMKVGQYDNGVPTEGVVIHDVMMNRPPTPADTTGTCYFNNQSGWAMPFDATPGDFNSSTCAQIDQAGHGLMNMPYQVGDTFVSNALHVKVQVISKTATTYRVRVFKLL